MFPNNSKYHICLTEYFTVQPLYLQESVQKKPNLRKLQEQPWQLIKAGMWEEMTEVLCDVFFIEAQAQAGLLDTHQTNYCDALSLITNQKIKKYVNDFYWIFLNQKHILREHPDLVFQQIYNQLQWKKGRTKRKIKDSKNVFLSEDRFFLNQYRKPQKREYNTTIEALAR